MTEQTIFNADQAQTQQQEPSKPFVIPTEAQDLIGDGKKYNSVDSALKSIPHAQTHIKTLEDENKALKDELLKRKTAEEVLNEIKATNSYQPQHQEQPSGVNVDQEALASIVENLLEKKTQQTQAVANASVVTNKFTEMYGDKAEVMYNKLAKDNGLSVYQLNQLAINSPAVVLNLAGVSNKPVLGRTQSDVNIQTQNQQDQYATKVPGQGATTKQLMNAFAESRRKVESQLKQ